MELMPTPVRPAPPEGNVPACFDPPKAPVIEVSTTVEAVDALQEVLKKVRALQKDQEEQVLSLDSLADQVSEIVEWHTAGKVKPALQDPTLQVTFLASSTENGDEHPCQEQSQTLLPEAQHATSGATPVPTEAQRWSVEHQTTQDAMPEFLKHHRQLAGIFESKDEEDANQPCYKKIGRGIVEHRWFERTIGVLIILNSVMLGVETENKIREHPDVWPVFMEHLFLGVYSVELMLRLMAYGAACFVDGWFIFDSLLVCLGVLTSVVEIAVANTGDTDLLGPVMVLRVLRVLRFVRALRVIKQFTTIWKLVRGLLCSLDVMASTCFLVSLMLYIFACLGMELIGGDKDLQEHPLTQSIALNSFGSCWQAMMTLMQFVTLDSVSVIYIPLVNQKPYLAVYFICIILVVAIALMNLVTAAIVDSSLQNSEHDREERKEQLKVEILKSLPELVKVFHDLDEDGSGNVSLAEVEHLHIDVLPQIVRDNISVDSMSDLFEMLDVDGGGELDMEEFVGGLLQLWLMDVPISTIQILKLSRLTRMRIEETTQRMSEEMDSIRRQLEKNTSQLRKRFDDSHMVGVRM